MSIEQSSSSLSVVIRGDEVPGGECVLDELPRGSFEWAVEQAAESEREPEEILIEAFCDGRTIWTDARPDPDEEFGFDAGTKRLETTRTIRSVGNSAVLCLPPQLTNAIDLSEGDDAMIQTDIDGDIVTVTPTRQSASRCSSDES